MQSKNLRNVKPNQDFVQMEKDILEYWESKGILQKYLDRNTDSGKRFSFIDGPITANNPMGVHHAWGRTYKDVVQKYKNMKGFKQRFQNGFDCQGLWVEVQVEKELGFNSKKDILDYGLDNFTNKCVARVNKYADIQTDQSKRLGMFMDWENSYYTMSETNNLYIWHFLKKCNEKGLLYKSKSATTWCPRCETGLSQHEQADAYKTISDKAVYVLFKLADSENEHVLAWTTTPWTLSANMLLAVNSNLEYVKANLDGKSVYLGKDAAGRLGIEEYEDISVKDLLGRKYESLLDIEAQEGVEHEIVEWELVDSESGSGVVHIAPGCGEEDFELGNTLGVEPISPIDSAGRFVDGYGFLSGKYAHDVADEVIALLEKNGQLFKTEEYEHSYPHCWRCKTKCLFRLEDNWFVKIENIREELKKEASEVEWLPVFVEKRMQDWLDNMGDWMISRSRFYGLALPFYECNECSHLEVVGSKEELKKIAVNPEAVDSLPSLHRPWIDEIEIKCPSCGEVVKRITDVGDCWLDAGVVSFSTLKYLEDRSYWEQWFPADFVVEMVEQVRLWFYSMLVFGVILEGKAPYKQVMCYGEVRDENNQRMSKTNPNNIQLEEAADKVGVDVMRWNFMTSSVGANMRFSYNTLEDVRRRFYLQLWNTYNYFVTYAKLHDWSGEGYDASNVENIMDRWIVSKVRSLCITSAENLDKYDVPRTTRDIEDFVKDLSQWYIRRSRNRFRDGDSDAIGTLHYVLVNLSKLLSPFMPFLAEEIYKNIVIDFGLEDAKESVYLEGYPLYEESDMDSNLLSKMDMVRELCGSGLKARESKGLSLRQPLAKAFVSLDDEELLDIVREELNVKEIESSESIPSDSNFVTVGEGDMYISLDTNLTKELKDEGIVNDFLRKYRDTRKKMGLKIDDLVELVIDVQDDEIRNSVESNLSKDDIQAMEVSYTEVTSPDGEFEIQGSKFKISIKK